MYSARTHEIEVTVAPNFLEDQSEPAQNRFFWSYAVSIANHSAKTVQLVGRGWDITDSAGRREEVRGAGVVGEQPILKPGDRFDYVSGCPLSTPSGIMVGFFSMIDEEGRSFDVAIPAFSLDSPFDRRILN